MERIPSFEPKKPEKKLKGIKKWLGAAGITAAAGLGIGEALSEKKSEIPFDTQTQEQTLETPPQATELAAQPRTDNANKTIKQEDLPIFKIEPSSEQEEKIALAAIAQKIEVYQSVLQGLEYKNELRKSGSADKREKSVNVILEALKESIEDISNTNAYNQSVNHWNLLANFIRGRGYTVSVESPRSR